MPADTVYVWQGEEMLSAAFFQKDAVHGDPAVQEQWQCFCDTIHTQAHPPRGAVRVRLGHGVARFQLMLAQCAPLSIAWFPRCTQRLKVTPWLSGLTDPTPRISLKATLTKAAVLSVLTDLTSLLMVNKSCNKRA